MGFSKSPLLLALAPLLLAHCGSSSGDATAPSTTSTGGASNGGSGGSSAGAAGTSGANGAAAGNGGNGGANAGAGGASAGAAGIAGAAGTAGSGGTFASPDDLAPYRKVPKSCVYQCPQSSCAELTKPYACPTLADWSTLPHAESCGVWDGTYPAVTQGQCTVSGPTGDAAKYAGKDPDDANTLIMPDGRRLRPAGSSWIFNESDAYSGMTTASAPVKGTEFVLTVDTGNGNHVVRAIDPAKFADPNGPVLSHVSFPQTRTLNQSIAFSAPDRVFVASADGIVQALTLDTATGTLAQTDSLSLTLPGAPDTNDPSGQYYVAGVAVSPDDTKLYAGGVFDSTFYVFDVTAGGAGYGHVLGSVDLPAAEVFGVYLDPNDPTGHFVYATMWDSKQVVEIDVSNPAMPTVTRSFAVDKDPEGLAFLDARYLVVGNDLGDTLSIVDRTSGIVTPIAVDTALDVKGLEPSNLAYDANAKRLYVTLAGFNALAAYDVDLSVSPPTLTFAGRLPTMWWPSSTVVASDGSLLVTSMQTRGSGPVGSPDDDEYSLLHGGIQRIDPPSKADLAASEAVVQSSNHVDELAGRPTISCPSGVKDFPVPATNTEGASNAIKHVFVVIRENKTFGGVMGDMSGVKASVNDLLTNATDTETIWKNLRTVARDFAFSDNFYTDAVISNQGHVWTTYGRSNDFNEREWPVTTYSRSTRPVGQSGGVPEISKAAEGSLFDWLLKNQVPVDILGEIVGGPETPELPGRTSVDAHYPGGPVQSISYSDVEKSCYMGTRARLFCDLGAVTYLTLPNDHTQGVGPTSPTPETCFAVNDEATGMLIDAISHSPIWKESLVMITEDDPAMGGDSVDYHRTIFVAASPWIRRGYVSHTHADISSMHKIIAHVLGLPYPNEEVAEAALPLDLFTSTPDYTPHTYSPRTWAASCGDGGSLAERRLTASWDFSREDDQPGLGAQVTRWVRHQQLQKLTPKLEAQVREREQKKARGEALDGDD